MLLLYSSWEFSADSSCKRWMLPSYRHDDMKGCLLGFDAGRSQPGTKIAPPNSFKALLFVMLVFSWLGAEN